MGPSASPGWGVACRPIAPTALPVKRRRPEPHPAPCSRSQVPLICTVAARKLVLSPEPSGQRFSVLLKAVKFVFIFVLPCIWAALLALLLELERELGFLASSETPLKEFFSGRFNNSVLGKDCPT